MNAITTVSVGRRLKALPERLALFLSLSQFSDTLGQQFSVVIVGLDESTLAQTAVAGVLNEKIHQAPRFID